MPLSPRCECGHNYFMHHGAGTGPDGQAGGCGDKVKKKNVRVPCLCRRYKPVTDGAAEKA